MGNAKCYLHTVNGHSIVFYLGPFLYLGALKYSKDRKASAEPKINAVQLYSAVAFLLLRKSTLWPLYALPALHHPYKVRTCLAGHVFIPWEESFTIYLYLVDEEKALSFTISPELKGTEKHVLGKGINRENMLQLKNNDLNNFWYQHSVLRERKKETTNPTLQLQGHKVWLWLIVMYDTRRSGCVGISHPHPTELPPQPFRHNSHGLFI